MNRVEWEKGHSDGFKGRMLCLDDTEDFAIGHEDGQCARAIRLANLPLPCVTMTAKEAYREYERRGLIPSKQAPRERQLKNIPMAQ